MRCSTAVKLGFCDSFDCRPSSRWVLLDYGSVIAHVFAPAEREFYGLERLWGKAAQVVRVV